MGAAWGVYVLAHEPHECKASDQEAVISRRSASPRPLSNQYKCCTALNPEQLERGVRQALLPALVLADGSASSTATHVSAPSVVAATQPERFCSACLHRI